MEDPKKFCKDCAHFIGRDGNGAIAEVCLALVKESGQDLLYGNILFTGSQNARKMRQSECGVRARLFKEKK